MEEPTPHRVVINGKARLIHPNATYDEQAVRWLFCLKENSRAIDQIPGGKLGDNKVFDGAELIEYVRNLCKRKPK